MMYEPKLDAFFIKLPKYTAPRFSFLNETCYTWVYLTTV